MPYGFVNRMHQAYVIQQVTQPHHKDTVTEVKQPEQPPKEPMSSDYIVGGFCVLFVLFFVVLLIKERV